MISAFIGPLMSLYLVKELQLPAYYIGIYTATVILSAVAVAQYFGHLADKGLSSKAMYLLATFGMCCAGISFANSDSFAAIFITALLFMSLGGAAVPQMLTLSRFYALQHQVAMLKFNARVRASISFAWIIGPPTAFLLASQVSFSAAFYSASALALSAFLFAWLKVPNLKKPETTEQEEDEQGTADLRFWLLSLVVLLGAGSNLMYSSSLPLYLIEERNLPDYLPGILMGTVAALEIPVMLWSAKLAAKFSAKHIVTLAFAFGAAFYGLMYLAEEFWQMWALQGLNAMFYGLCAGLGLSILQQHLPHRSGFVSALYSNAMKLGVMLGTSVAGIAGHFWGFQAVNLIAMATALFAGGLMILLTLTQPKQA